jgi:hypothetical protein
MAAPWTIDSLIKIGGKIFKLKDLMNRYVYAARPLPLYRSVYNLKVAYMLKPGEGIGTVYSFISQDGVNYLSFYDQYQKPYYVPIGDNDLQLDSLISQSVSPLPTPGQIAQQQTQQAAQGSQTFLGVSQQVVTLGILVAGAAYIIVNWKGK